MVKRRHERGQPCLIPHVVPKAVSDGPNNWVVPDRKIECKMSKIPGGSPLFSSKIRRASLGGVSNAWYKSSSRHAFASGVVQMLSSSWVVAMPQERPPRPPYWCLDRNGTKIGEMTE